MNFRNIALIGAGATVVGLAWWLIKKKLEKKERKVMLALQDYNTPKIVTEDVTLFTGLGGLELEKQIRQATVDLRLQPKYNCMKWVQSVDAVKIPASGSVINYCTDSKSKQFLSWSDSVSSFQIDPDIPLQVDTCGNMEAHSRQFLDMDYSHWSDITMSICLKDIRKVMFTLSKNNTASGFTVDFEPRGKFYVFAFGFLSGDALYTIYSSILNQHFKNTANVLGDIVKLEINFIDKTLTVFIPKAITSHYICNLKDKKKRIMSTTGECVSTTSYFNHFGMDETSRVYFDEKKSCEGEGLTRKPMKNFPKNPSEYQPVLLINQLIPGIKYHTLVVSNPPSVVQVSATIHNVSFVKRGSTKKAAMVEVAVMALSYFYSVPPSTFGK